MTNKFEIYKCDVCGNMAEIIHGGQGQLVCCNESMKLINSQSEESMFEKHKPVIKSENTNITIKVGETFHPMTLNHHINFIEAISLDGKYLYRKYLDIEELPLMEFFCKTDKMKARELCNIHGLFATVNE